MKALIFGSGGYIGTYLADALKLRGYEVIAESSSKDGAAIDPRQGCIKDGYKFPVGIDVVFYLSQSPHYRNLPLQFEHLMAVNCFAAYRVAKMAAAAGVSKFIYTSTGTVYEPAFTPLSEDSRLCCDDLYSLSKIAAERVLQNIGEDIQICCARLFGVYGPNQTNKMFPNLCHRLSNRQNIYLEYDPKTREHSGLRLSVTYVADVVSALIALSEMGAPLPVVNVSSLDAPSIREIVIALAARLGISPEFEELDREVRGYYIANSSLLRNNIERMDTPLSVGLDYCIK
ncbi:MAG: NAD(P)-dependent oxidoreductase [Smithella sp.]